MWKNDHHHQLIFYFNDPATTEIYTRSLHDALPISGAPRPGEPPPARRRPRAVAGRGPGRVRVAAFVGVARARDGGARHQIGSTRLNSSHANISYAVFCLKKNTFSNSPSPCTLPDTR